MEHKGINPWELFRCLLTVLQPATAGFWAESGNNKDTRARRIHLLQLYINMRDGGKAFWADFVAWNTSLCANFLLHSTACSLGCSETAAVLATFCIPCLVRKEFGSYLQQTNVSAYSLPGFWTDLPTAALNEVRVGSFIPLQDFFFLKVLAFHFRSAFSPSVALTFLFRNSAFKCTLH